MLLCFKTSISTEDEDNQQRTTTVAIHSRSSLVVGCLAEVAHCLLACLPCHPSNKLCVTISPSIAAAATTSLQKWMEMSFQDTTPNDHQAICKQAIIIKLTSQPQLLLLSKARYMSSGSKGEKPQQVVMGQVNSVWHDQQPSSSMMAIAN